MLKCMSKGQLLLQHNWSAFVRLKVKESLIVLHQNLNRLCTPALTADYHTSIRRYGLEMFFEDEDKRGERVVKHGRAWSAEELRQKDNTDLHKLWFVLLKEHNLLLTLEHESERLEKYMPSPERLEKVELSMKELEGVLGERDAAINELETGYEKREPGRWINSPLGYKRLAQAREYYVPLHVNKRMARKRNSFEPWTQGFKQLYLENVLKDIKRGNARERHRIRKLKKRFPDADID